METKDFVIGFAAGKLSGVKSVYAFIDVNYPAGFVCTATKGSKTLTAPNTSGHVVFPIPEEGAWVIADGVAEESVIISYHGQSEAVTLRHLDIVPWSTGTDEQIVMLIQAAHNGIINLQQDAGWAIGDARTITVNSFTGNGKSFSQQLIDIVISSFSDYNSCGCVLQFDFGDSLAEEASMGGDRPGKYSETAMYYSILPNLANALPSWLKKSLITFDVLDAGTYHDGYVMIVPNNKLALRSEKEFMGNTEKSYDPGDTQTPLYVGTGVVKPLGHGAGGSSSVFTRSVSRGGEYRFVTVRGTNRGTSNSSNAVAPFGCL